MSEKKPGCGDYSYESDGVDDRIEKEAEAGIIGLVDEAEIQIGRPQGRDPHIQGFAWALRDLLSRERRNHDILNFQAAIHEAFKTRIKNGRSMIPWVDMNLLRLAFQKQVMLEQDTLPEAEWRYSEEKYPWSSPDKEWTIHDIFDYAGKWQVAFRNILTDNEDDLDPRRKGLGAQCLFRDIAEKDVMTTKPDRYKSVQYELNRLSAAGELPADVRILDIGTGVGFGLKMTADPLMNFGKVEILHEYKSSEFARLSTGEIDHLHGMEPDLQLTSAINYRINTRTRLGECYGVDRVSFEDEDIRNTARYSHYAKELEDPNTLKNFDELAALQIPNVHFIAADLTKERPAELQNYKCDVVTLVTMMNLLNQEEGKKIIDAAKSYLDPNGPQKIIIVDFAVEDPTCPTGIRFLEHMTLEPFPYRMFVIDLKDPEPRPKTRLAWTGGRCEKGVIIED